MGGLKMFLEGPGLERRAVRLLRIDRVPLEVLRRVARKGEAAMVDLQVLVDADGNEARQIDQDGLRYRFDSSASPWALVVS